MGTHSAKCIAGGGFEPTLGISLASLAIVADDGAPLAFIQPEDLMRSLLLLLMLLSTFTMAGCDMIGDIFQAGVAVGVIMVVLIVAGIAFVVRKLRR